MQTVVAIVALAIAAFSAGFAVGRQRGQTVPPLKRLDFSGTYEWQWAGENWYGKIALSEHNTISRARVGVLKKVYASDGSARFNMQDKVLELVNGTYSQKDESKVKIDMLVNKKVRGAHPKLQQRIVGTLEKRLCLAGQVEYQDYLTGTTYLGDMILVGYSSHLGEDVATWCAKAR